MKLKDIKISYENGWYTAVYEDKSGSVITDGKTLDKLFKNLKEALELHFSKETKPASIDFSRFKINLTTFSRLYAPQLQVS